MNTSMHCRKCRTPLHPAQTICNCCGGAQFEWKKGTTCVRCRKQIQVGLAVCPRCGRAPRRSRVTQLAAAVSLSLLCLVTLWYAARWELPQYVRMAADALERRSSHQNLALNASLNASPKGVLEVFWP